MSPFYHLLAIRGIKRETLNEIKSLKTPPSAIADVLCGVLIFLRIEVRK